MRLTVGTASFNSCSRLAAVSQVKPATPVTFPPGCDRLVTYPPTSGSTEVITIGICLVALIAAIVGGKDADDRNSGTRFSVADHRHRFLLRVRSERPCRHRDGEKNYEIASPHARPLALTASRTNVNWNSPDAQPDSCTRTIRA